MPKTSEKTKEARILRRFIEVYCRAHCSVRDGRLCPDCQDLWEYASRKLEKCPFDPKPKCKDCTVHCYTPEYRQRIRQVMKFSGMHFAKRGRVDWLIRYFLLGRKAARRAGKGGPT